MKAPNIVSARNDGRLGLVPIGWSQSGKSVIRVLIVLRIALLGMARWRLIICGLLPLVLIVAIAGVIVLAVAFTTRRDVLVVALILLVSATAKFVRGFFVRLLRSRRVHIADLVEGKICYAGRRAGAEGGDAENAEQSAQVEGFRRPDYRSWARPAEI